MLEKLQEKNKLWGRVLGRIVQAKVENAEIPDPVMKCLHHNLRRNDFLTFLQDFMYRSNDFWSHFTVLLYREGLPAENDGSLTEQQDFW